MAVSAYPKQLEPRVTRGSLAFFGIVGLIGFTLTFAITWYFPATGMIWIAATAAQFVWSVIFSRDRILHNLTILILTIAAVFSAAALR